jgi:hypothetical protein
MLQSEDVGSRPELGGKLGLAFCQMNLWKNTAHIGRKTNSSNLIMFLIVEDDHG